MTAIGKRIDYDNSAGQKPWVNSRESFTHEREGVDLVGLQRCGFSGTVKVWCITVKRNVVEEPVDAQLIRMNDQIGQNTQH